MSRIAMNMPNTMQRKANMRRLSEEACGAVPALAVMSDMAVVLVHGARCARSDNSLQCILILRRERSEPRRMLVRVHEATTLRGPAAGRAPQDEVHPQTKVI